MAPFVVLPILLGFLPLFLDDYGLHVMINAFFYVMMAASWNLLAGYTGQVSFAHAAFAGIGAYTSGILCAKVAINPWLGVLIGVFMAGLLGFLIGIVCLRMGGIYLSLTTLGFSEILRIIITNEYETTRGTMGLHVPTLIEPYSKTWYFYIMLIAAIVVLLAVFRMIYSDTGLNFRAVQNDEKAAASAGVDVVRVRIVAFTVSSLMAGMAGGLYGHYLLLITPEIPSLDQQFFVLAMAVIGGLGSFAGPIIGAFVLVFLSEYIRNYGEYHVLVFGCVALLVARFAPNGLIGVIERAWTKIPAVSEKPKIREP